jgi:hypothetical protein
MRILVTGSRYRPGVDVRNVLDRYRGVATEIVVGSSTGADAAARAWARANGVPCKTFQSDDEHNHLIGFSKDAMDEKPDLCLAFPIGNSRGTITAIEMMRRSGTPVTVIPEFDNEDFDRKHDGAVIMAAPSDGELMRVTLDKTVEIYEKGIRELADL